MAHYFLGFHVAQVVDEFDGFPCVGDAEAFAGQDVFVHAGVQVGEAAAEFDFFIIYCDAAVGGFAFGSGFFGYIMLIQREVPTYRGMLQLDEAGILCSSERCSSLCCTGPKNHISISKKWTPMLVAMPPDLL